MKLLPRGRSVRIKITQNLLLRLLSDDDREALGQFENVVLPIRTRLDGIEDGDRYAYFMESGIASVVADVEGTLAVELGIIGHEGTTALSGIYGDTESAFQIFMQVEGSAVRCEMAALRRAMDERPAVRALMLRFARAFSIQIATTALANGRFKLDERLARWLLMVSDRVGPSFHITHEFIAIMLGVRRSGVTLAVQILEGKRFIRASRGLITVVDRDGLIAAANGSYGFCERQYRRLLVKDA